MPTSALPLRTRLLLLQRRLLAGPRARLQEEGPLILRLILAATIAYTAIHYITGKNDLTGTVAALLVVQATVYKTFENAFARVAAVVSGVFFAVYISSYGGINVGTVFLAVTGSLLLGVLFRFSGNLLEIPISALLILGASSHEVAAETRLLNTLIGTAVGLGILLLFPPRPKISMAVEAVSSVAEVAAERTEAIAAGLQEGPLEVTALMKTIHVVQPQVEEARRVVEEVRQEYLLNYTTTFGEVRRRYEVNLMEALDALDACLPQLQKLLISLDARRHSRVASAMAEDLAESLKEIYVTSLQATATTLRAFGAYLHASPEEVKERYIAVKAAQEHLQGAEGMLIEVATMRGVDEASSAFASSMVHTIRSINVNLNVDELSVYAPRATTPLVEGMERLQRNALSPATSKAVSWKRAARPRTRVKNALRNRRPAKMKKVSPLPRKENGPSIE